MNDFLEDDVAINTRVERELPWPNRFAQIMDALRQAFPKDLGSLYLAKLRKCKLDDNEDILSYNARYKALFNEALKFNRVNDGLVAIEDYIQSLPIHELVNSFVVGNSNSFDGMKLIEVQRKLATSIMFVRKDGILKPKKTSSDDAEFVAFNQSPRNLRYGNQEGQRYSNQGYRYPRSPKKKCNKCGLYSNRCPDRCPVTGKQCRKCKGIGHLARTCRSHKNASINQNQQHSTSYAQAAMNVDSWTGFVTQDMTAAAIEIAGLDTCASSCLINDENLLVKKDTIPKIITLANGRKLKTTASGIAQITLKGLNNEEIRINLPANVLKHNRFNLISAGCLWEAGSVMLRSGIRLCLI